MRTPRIRTMKRSRIRMMTLATVLAAGALAPLGTSSAAAAYPCDYPAQQLNLTNWKVTLPIGSSGSPTEVKQPALATYSHNPYFMVNEHCTGIQFRAPVNGVTTSGSSYPRSELREMTNNGSSNASWSATSGTHTLTFRLAFKGLPNDKPHIVGAQIHNGNDDVSVFRLEGTKLWITQGNSKHTLITDTYSLNTVFEGKFVVSGGQIKAYYNGSLKATIPYTGSGNYFKTGAYTQANCTNSSPCSTSNYGQSHLYALQVTHS